MSYKETFYPNIFCLEEQEIQNVKRMLKEVSNCVCDCSAAEGITTYMAAMLAVFHMIYDEGGCNKSDLIFKVRDIGRYMEKFINDLPAHDESS